MRPAYLGILFVLLVSILGCETDVYTSEAKAPYPVVHCILNKYDTAHYLRLTKTFSGTRDAYEMAHNLDSLYFGDARVFFDLWDDNCVYHTIELQPTWEVHRQPGIFPEDSLMLYKTTEEISYLRLRIEIPSLDQVVIGIGRPGGHPQVILPDPDVKKILSFYETDLVRIEWLGTTGACETVICIWYEEVYEDHAETKMLDWTRHSCNFVILPEDLLKFLSWWIEDDQAVLHRRLLGIDLILTSGDYSLVNYLKYKDFSFDFIEKPYSNLVNAYGIIAGISRDTLTDFMPNQKFNDSLANGQITGHLKFVNW